MSERNENRHEIPEDDREFYFGLGWAVAASVAVASLLGIA